MYWILALDDDGVRSEAQVARLAQHRLRAQLDEGQSGTPILGDQSMRA